MRTSSQETDEIYNLPPDILKAGQNVILVVQVRVSSSLECNNGHPSRTIWEWTRLAHIVRQFHSATRTQS
jgi:hypothetical protein